MSDTTEQETARVFADVRDFPIYVSHIDDNTRMWFAPWRIWDGATFLLGGAATGWATYHWLDSGYAVAIVILGGGATAGATYLARQVPVSRPSPLYRIIWLLGCVIGTQQRAAARGKCNPWLSPPKAVIDNLVFSHGGVYAEFILAGQPGGMLPYEEKRAVARGHRPLVRELPSGAVFWGVCAPHSARRLLRRMLDGFDDHPAWVREVRDWETFLRIEPFYEQVFGVRVPVDAGLAGRTGAGAIAKGWKVVVGRDHDDPATLAGYRELVDDLLGKIPEQFAARPATPRQIRWLYHRHWTRGAADTPFPQEPGGPDRFTAADFADMPADFDEGDQHARHRHRSWLRRHLPSLAPIQRIETATAPDSYQALLPLSQLPRPGLFFPRAEYLLSIYDVDVHASVDWYQHVTVRPREKALIRVDRAQRNLDDQAFQRGGRRAGNADLAQRYESAEDYSAELEASKLEREAEWTTVVAVGSPSAQATVHAAQQLRTHFAEELDTALGQPPGAQCSLWQIGVPGSEERAPRGQFSQPTTTRHWARFAPLLSSELGNETGILLARNMATRRPSPVLVDPEGATKRRGAPGMLLIGAPGGGKSQASKRVVDGLIKRGSQASIIDPGTMREWVPALAHHGDRVAVIDPTGGQWSMDGLRIFPRDVAVEHTLDHWLPMMGAEATSAIARQLRRLLRPDMRVAESSGGLLRYLNAVTGAERADYAELTDTLNYWSELDYLRAMFDESLPVPPIAEKDAVIWLTGSLELPEIAETDELHLYKRQTPRARAGLAIYGMIAALSRVTYTDPDRRRPGAFGWFVAEEARTYLSSPVGRKDAMRIATQGRKERYGLIGISQHAEDFDGIGAQNLPMRVITPFKPTERDYARQAFTKLGIDPDEYPEVLGTRTVDGHGYAYFIDDSGRAGMVDLLHPVQRELIDAFDTRYLQDGPGSSGQLARTC
jgi:hypothetical protein